MCGFDEIQRGNYFGGKKFGIAEIEMRVEKLKKGNSAGKDKITGDRVTGWWILSGGYVIWLLKVELRLKIGDLLGLFYCTRLNERGLNVRTIEVLAC